MGGEGKSQEGERGRRPEERLRRRRRKGGGRNRFHVLGCSLDVVYESGTINLTNKEGQ